MCLIAFAYKIHPEYKLILIANRDEFYFRPTQHMHWWDLEGHSEVLAGKDLKAGGTWMGFTKSAKWTAITNYRDPSLIKEEAPSRGKLTLDYLTGNQTPENYLKSLDSIAEKFNGFNLLTGNGDQIFHYSNMDQKVSLLEPGFHGVSNALLNTSWPKLDQAKKELAQSVSDNRLDSEHLFNILANQTKANDETLPRTGIPIHLERAISSIFIDTDNYGTRCSTVFKIDYRNKVTVCERMFNPGNPGKFDTHSFTLQW